MKSCWIDHLVVTAPDLETGAGFVRNALGVEMQQGGKHPRMGTHNLVLRLGDSCYLEVIAPDPDAQDPGRPRWFSLDSLKPYSPAKLSTWVARTLDIRAACSESSVYLGEIEKMSRGELTWDITITADGNLCLGGALPSLIQWHTQAHPALSMAEKGCILKKFVIRHPDRERLKSTLDLLGFVGPLEIEREAGASTPLLVALIDTPDGTRKLPLT